MTDTKRQTDQTGPFGQANSRRVSQSHETPGVAAASERAASGKDAYLPPLASSPPDAAPLRERFARRRE
jgi:hypothetical protein